MKEAKRNNPAAELKSSPAQDPATHAIQEAIHSHWVLLVFQGLIMADWSLLPKHPYRLGSAPIAYASRRMREELTAELKLISSAEEAANWAHRVMAAKNRLTVSDAEHVERAFEGRLVSITNQSEASSIPNAEQPLHRRGRKDRRRGSVIDKSVLALSAPRRIRDRQHVKSVAKQPCLVCGRRPADAHHLRFAQSPALGRKISDEFTVPLCRGHHREVHRCGDESVWWNKTGIDATVAARVLWLKSHPLLGGVGAAGEKPPNEPNLVRPR